jgi:hypothetical protein
MRSKARKLRRSSAAAACALVVLLLGAVAADYRNDFSDAAPGAPPKDLQVVGGGFQVVELEKNKVLELPGEPLEIGGVLFGPKDHASVDVRAKIFGINSGRRSPEFGVGAGDVAGYKLMVLPAQKRIELRKGDEVVQSVEMTEPWQSGAWTSLRLQMVAGGDGKWTVRGKTWPANGVEPQAWQVSYAASQAPSPGRASVWGTPFSGQPIRFDDLSVSLATVK